MLARIDIATRFLSIRHSRSKPEMCGLWFHVIAVNVEHHMLRQLALSSNVDGRCSRSIPLNANARTCRRATRRQALLWHVRGLRDVVDDTQMTFPVLHLSY